MTDVRLTGAIAAISWSPAGGEQIDPERGFWIVPDRLPVCRYVLRWWHNMIALGKAGLGMWEKFTEYGPNGFVRQSSNHFKGDCCNNGDRVTGGR